MRIPKFRVWDNAGYTSSRINAGFYTEREAKEVCDHPNSSCKYKPVSELFSLAELNEIESNVQQIKYQIELDEVQSD